MAKLMLGVNLLKARALCAGCLVLVIVASVQVQAGMAESVGVKQAGKEAPAEQSGDAPVLTGSVEGFTMDRLYIDGADYALAKHIDYYSSQGNPVAKENIKRGCRVKFVLSPSKEVEIIQPEPGQDNDDW